MAGSLEEDLEAASLLAPEKAWVHFLGSPFLGPFSPDQFLRFIFLVPLSLDHFHSQSDPNNHKLLSGQKQLSMYVIKRAAQCVSPILLRTHALPENWVQTAPESSRHCKKFNGNYFRHTGGHEGVAEGSVRVINRLNQATNRTS